VAEHRIVETNFDGYKALRLESVTADITATFVPSAGMVGVSLTHHGKEILVHRGGLASYVEAGKTFGIPLLHPWANRLDGNHYRLGEVEVDLAAVSALVHHDNHGLPIHGLAAACPDWQVTETGANSTSAQLAACLDIGPQSPVFAGFPFAHGLELRLALSATCLSIATTLTATGDRPVPVSFGWHPYFQLPGVPRKDWIVDLPVGRQYVLDSHSLPTKERRALRIEKAPLGERAYDDLFDDLRPGANGIPIFTLAGGGRQIAVSFETGYPYAIVWAPAGQDLICFEPMTAPTNALATGWPELTLVQPGQSHTCRFSIEVR
jgi:aldose 1-epimerase